LRTTAASPASPANPQRQACRRIAEHQPSADVTTQQTASAGGGCAALRAACKNNNNSGFAGFAGKTLQAPEGRSPRNGSGFAGFAGKTLTTSLPANHRAAALS